MASKLTPICCSVVLYSWLLVIVKESTCYIPPGYSEVSVCRNYTRAQNKMLSETKFVPSLSATRLLLVKASHSSC